MKKLMLSTLFASLLAFGFVNPAIADDRLQPYTSINGLQELGVTSIGSTDYVLGFDTSDNNWKKIPATNIGVSTNFEDVTATNALTTAECGKTMTLNSTTEFATTLPAPTVGCYFKFIVKAAPSGASYTVVTASSANILIGGINELEVDTGDDGAYDNNGDTITFVNSVSVVGDYVEMISDGTSWYLNGQANADGGITVTGS